MADFLGSWELLGQVCLGCFWEILVVRTTLQHRIEPANLWRVCSLRSGPE